MPIYVSILKTSEHRDYEKLDTSEERGNHFRFKYKSSFEVLKCRNDFHQNNFLSASQNLVKKAKAAARGYRNVDEISERFCRALGRENVVMLGPCLRAKKPQNSILIVVRDQAEIMIEKSQTIQRWSIPKPPETSQQGYKLY